MVRVKDMIVILVLALALTSSAAMITHAHGNVTRESATTILHELAPPTPITPSNLHGQKLVALTFDDGPVPNTSALLDILKQEKVTVTFFVLGQRVNRFGDITQRAYAEGHQIASHTTNHKDLTKLPPPARQAEIGGTVDAIERTVGVKPTVMRPPYGAWNADVMSDAGVPLVLWSIDTNDWKYRNPDQIYEHVMANVRDGSIVLFHDIYPSSVQAAAKIIPALKQQGYAIVTINRLIMARDGSFAPEHYYRHFYP
jgi:peptidoglycan/xylan/chitin deacetylase (PgdA/CDA1 family)